MRLQGQVPTARRTHADTANGVSFSYPAGWTMNGDDDAATAKLRVALSSQATAVVTLEGNFADAGPYKDTEFEAGAFAYVVSPAKTEVECFATIEGSAEGDQRSAVAMWSGMPARRLNSTYTVAGTDDVHHIVSAFRRGRCYSFETVIVSHDPKDAAKPLGQTRWRQLRAEFAEVLASVRIAGAKP